MTVKLHIDGVETPFSQWKFPGGEVGVFKITNLNSKFAKVTVDGLPSSDDILTAINLIDALNRDGIWWMNIELYMPYFPYARQDRVCHAGESFALEVFVKLLSTVKFGTLSTCDLHSNVARDLFWKHLEDVYINHVEQHEKANELLDYAIPYDFVIAPDAGALEKSKKFSVHSQHVFLNKTRKDGQVIYEDYPWDTIQGRAIVVDDICDGGATFISLGKMLRRTQPKLAVLDLYVTHGIFSRGVDCLLEVYDNIYCFNNMQNLNLKGLQK